MLKYREEFNKLIKIIYSDLNDGLTNENTIEIERIQDVIESGIARLEDFDKPKKYLKYEDLETTKTYYGLLNGEKYQINLFSPVSSSTHSWEVRLINVSFEEHWVFIHEENAQFFNHLHIIEVEE